MLMPFTRLPLCAVAVVTIFSPLAHGQNYPPVVYCFAQGTSPETIEAFYGARGLSGPIADPQFFASTRWSGAAGSPRALTWSFAPDGVLVPYSLPTGGSENRSSQLFARMDALFASKGGRAAWVALYQSCFDRWGSITGTSYTRIKSGADDWDDGANFGSSGSAARGDIRIYMITQDGVNNVLAYNYYPSSGMGGDQVLDSAENWANTSNNYRFLRNVVMHEHGHGLGLAHVCPTNGTKLMEPFLNTSFDGPQQDDIRGVQSLYGDDYEDNDTVATAKSIGVLTAGTSMDLGVLPSPTVPNGAALSINATGDSDYYKFTVSAGVGLSLTLIPVGLSYDSSTQSSVDGSCSSGNFINSLTMADLNMQIIGPNGTTVLANAGDTAAGSSETITRLLLATAGDYYLRVYANGTVSGPQLYHVQISVGVMDCNQNGTLDSIDIAAGTSIDCNADGIPDECEPQLDLNGDGFIDSCQLYHGDLDLDGDVDLSDFGILQACLAGGTVVVTSDCTKASLDGDTHVTVTDLNLLKGCIRGAGIPIDWSCR